MTTIESRPAHVRPTPAQIAAAKLVIAADRKLGDKTPSWIQRVADGLPPR